MLGLHRTVRVSRLGVVACFGALLLSSHALAAVLPAGSAVPGWKQIGATRTYNSNNLFDLIDGGAQAVMEYGFVSCAHAEYAPAKQARPALTIDAYQMTDPLNAFGMFSSSDRMSGAPVAVGAEGVRIGQTALNFWKGSYVVRATILQPTPANVAALNGFARATAAKIPGASSAPALLKALPPGRRPRSEMYVRRNVAGHAFLSNAVKAQYPSAGQGAEVFIAQYPTPAAAKSAFQQYMAFERTGAGLAPVKGIGEQAFKVTDRFAKQVVVAQKGRYVIGAHHFRDANAALAMVRQAAGKVR